MKTVSKLALGAALAAGAAALLLSGSAYAQRGAEAVPAGPGFNLSKEERAAIAALQTVVASRNLAAAPAASATAQNVSRSSDAHYLIGSLILKLGNDTNNLQMQSHGIESMLASGGVPAADLPALYRNQAALASAQGVNKKADAALAKLAELTPNDPETLVMLAEVRNDLGQVPEAVRLMDRAIDIRRAAGQPVQESWYKRAIKLAYDAKLAPQAIKFSREHVMAYPSTENWRDALLINRELAAADPAANLDFIRLMRQSKAFAGERDYLEAARTLDAAGYPGEAKAILDEGVAAKMIDPTEATFKALIASSAKRSTPGRAALAGLATKAAADVTGAAALTAADAHLGYGEYGKAADLYRSAVLKGGVDAGTANTRLGIALALAGRKAEAETALRTVNGPRAEIAALWLTWLAPRA